MQVAVTVVYIVGEGNDKIGWCVVCFVQIVGHHIRHIAYNMLLLVVEMAHQEETYIVAFHQVEKLVVFLLGQIGGGGGAIVIAGSEEAGVGIDHHVAVVGAVLQHLLEPLELATTVGGVAAIEEDEKVAGSPYGLNRNGIGGRVEILLVVLLAVEIDVVIAYADKTCVGCRRQMQQAVEQPEGSRTTLVGEVAIDDGEQSGGVSILGLQETLHPSHRIGKMDIGADIYIVVVGGTGDDGLAVKVVPFEPLGHAVLGVCAAGEKHALNIKAVARCDNQHRCKNDHYAIYLHN